MTEPLRLLVVDDHEVVQKGLRSLLDRQPNWQNARAASSGRLAAKRAKELQPDVTVLDIGLPSQTRLENTRYLSSQDPRAKVLIMSMYESDPLIQEVLDAGARGYLLKSDAGKDLVTAVEAVRRNKAFLTTRVDDRSATDGHLNKNQRMHDAEATPIPLTPRQLEVLRLLAEGKSNKEVAVALGLSVKTAETHRANIMRRLECHSICELVRYAIRNSITVA